jgi:hypothetical protein
MPMGIYSSNGAALEHANRMRRGNFICRVGLYFILVLFVFEQNVSDIITDKAITGGYTRFRSGI